MINITSSEPINSIEHFPNLSEVNNKKRQTPKVKETISRDDGMFWDSISDSSKILKREKNYICKFILKGEECPYGKRCNCAHFKEELVIRNCSFGDRCNKIKILKSGKLKNLNSTSCMFQHPSESVEEYYERFGVKPGMMEKPVVDPVTFHYTKMCNSYFDKVECESKDECTYAHTVEQLKITPCNFKERCIHVFKDSNGEYTMASGTKKICRFLHPEETRENYTKRVVSFMKRTEIPSKEENKIIDKVINSKDPMVITVPENLAKEMMEALLASGKKNVEVKTY